ncbi:hypothetical protein BH09ACT12_BH09ACT12_32700 [soil metagenome]
MTDVASLWDFDDPAGSEERFRAAADAATGDERLILQTQVARALGLQGRYEEGHAVLDAEEVAAGGTEVGVRRTLERGRLLRSADRPREARPLFVHAALTAGAAGLDALHVDALHMVALVGAPAEQLALTEEALAVARTSSDPAARAWEPSLLNNLAMAHADAGDWSAALAGFEEALVARARLGDDRRTRTARWLVAWALRNLDRREEALAIQETLRAELDSLGEQGPYVDEELELLRR